MPSRTRKHNHKHRSRMSQNTRRHHKHRKRHKHPTTNSYKRNPIPYNRSAHRHPHTLYIYFVHVPKTAGSAIKQVLATNDLQHKGIKSEGWTLRTRSGTTVRILARGHCPTSQFPPRARNVFKMATIREPVDRFISAYNFVREGGKNHPNQGAVQQARNWAPFLQKYDTIDAFLNDKKAVQTIMHPKTGHTHFDHLMRWIHDHHGKPDIDFFIRQTHVNADFKAFCDTFGLQLADGTIKPFNVTGEKSKETKTTRKRIAMLLQRDIEVYNHILRSLSKTHRTTQQRANEWAASE